MTVQTFYRCAVWLPLLVPALTAVGVHGLGARPTFGPTVKLVQMLLMSGVYGGLPYAMLAAWATYWIDERPESEIRRRALQAPFWMLGAWIPMAGLFGVLSGRFELFLGLAGLGAVVIFPLGYAYVALVFMLRRAMSWVGWLATTPSSV
jgi:hypothetical protein